jgi:hypothetical protein
MTVVVGKSPDTRTFQVHRGLSRTPQAKFISRLRAHVSCRALHQQHDFDRQHIEAMFLRDNPLRTRPQISYASDVVKLVILDASTRVQSSTTRSNVGTVSKRAIDSVSARSHGTGAGSNVDSAARGATQTW